MKNWHPLSQKSIFSQKGVKKTQNQTKTQPKSDLAQIFRVVQAQQMIKVCDEKFDPPQAKNRFLAKKGIKNPKLAQNSNHVGLSSNFQGSFREKNTKLILMLN